MIESSQYEIDYNGNGLIRRSLLLSLVDRAHADMPSLSRNQCINYLRGYKSQGRISRTNHMAMSKLLARCEEELIRRGHRAEEIATAKSEAQMLDDKLAEEIKAASYGSAQGNVTYVD